MLQAFGTFRKFSAPSYQKWAFCHFMPTDSPTSASHCRPGSFRVNKNEPRKLDPQDLTKSKRYGIFFTCLNVLFILETHVTNDTMHTQKAKGVRSAPHTPQIFCTNSVPSFKTNIIFPSRCTTAFSTAASHNCVSNSGSIPFCPVNIL